MEPLALRELLAECRQELDDAVQPYLWPDESLIRHLNEAVSEACIRARLLVESRRDDICLIPLQAGVADYRLHPSVIVIRRVVLEGQPREDPILRTTTDALDTNFCAWRAEGPGSPEYLIRDAQSRELMVHPAPRDDGALRLTVWRVPTVDEKMESPDDEPAIDALHHDKLYQWACYRALSKRDSEENSSGAIQYLELFEANFGPRPTARQLQSLATDTLTGSAPVWF